MGWTQQKIDKQLKSLKERRDYYQALEKRREEERREASATNRAQANAITKRLANDSEMIYYVSLDAYSSVS